MRFAAPPILDAPWAFSGASLVYLPVVPTQPPLKLREVLRSVRPGVAGDEPTHGGR